MGGALRGDWVADWLGGGALLEEASLWAWLKGSPPSPAPPFSRCFLGAMRCAALLRQTPLLLCKKLSRELHETPPPLSRWCQLLVQQQKSDRQVRCP